MIVIDEARLQELVKRVLDSASTEIVTVAPRAQRLGGPYIHALVHAILEVVFDEMHDQING